MKTTTSRGKRMRNIEPGPRTFNLSAAKACLGRLVEMAAHGEVVYIAKGRHRFVLQAVTEIDPIPIRPPGYFADVYDHTEIRELNRLAKFSVIRPPKDLE